MELLDGLYAAVGAVVMKAIDGAIRWRKGAMVGRVSEAKAHQIDVESFAKSCDVCRQHQSWAIDLLKTQIEAVREDVERSRAETERQRAEAERLEREVAIRDDRIADLERRVEHLDKQLRTAMLLLRDRSRGDDSEGETG